MILKVLQVFFWECIQSRGVLSMIMPRQGDLPFFHPDSRAAAVP
jgi:hypothetical protein